MIITADGEKIILLRSLKGAPIEVLVAMLFFPRRQHLADLMTETGYDKKTLINALRLLETIGMVQRSSPKSGWVLSSQARQALLPGLLNQLEPVNAEIPSLPGSSNSNDRPDFNTENGCKNSTHFETPPTTHFDSKEQTAGEMENRWRNSTYSDPVLPDAPPENEQTPTETENRCKNSTHFPENEKIGGEFPPNESLVKLRVNSLTSELETLNLLDSQPPKVSESPPSAASLLEAAGRLFGARIHGTPGEYAGREDLLLAWIAYAWHRRGPGRKQVHSPAGLVYNRMRQQGELPDRCYFDRPADFLPTPFLESVGLPSAEIIDLPSQQPEPVSPDPALDIPLTTGVTPRRLWQQVLEHLESTRSKAQFTTWIDGASLLAFSSPASFTIGVCNAFARDWLEQNVTPTSQSLLTGLTGAPAEVKFVISQDC